ncbi:MAG TPA: hypothetical protein EYQ74_08555 [Planctomycetes bacterium]|nr:hypothetical protein [Planctomycetota bacterium]HIK60122.1 hypothetical protein [Planctomycetota bacterium]
MISKRASAAFNLLALLGTAPLAGAQDGERALLLVDPSNPESLYVANHYAEKRGIPPQNMIFMRPGTTDYSNFVATNMQGFVGELANTGMAAQVDFVVVPPSDNYYISAPGLVTDQCSPVTRFTVPGAYGLYRQSADIQAGLPINTPNHFFKSIYSGNAFDSEQTYYFGVPSSNANAESYLIPTMLGYTGTRGNTLQEVLDMIDRSVATDFTAPLGTVYYMETTDSARSSPRHDKYPLAVDRLNIAGGAGQHLLSVLPLGNHDCLGVMTGWASPSISDPNFSLLPGSFADHLTSYAGSFWTGSQTKMSAWITKGASGTAGTIEEPCNYSGKFPHPLLHVAYYKGVTLGEAWFRSTGFMPFQSLFLGDPLTRPYGSPPFVDLPGAPQNPVSGTIVLSPVASGTAPGASIAKLDLLVDGVRLDTADGVGTFTLDTTELTDGWHDLRILATDSKMQRNVGRWAGSLIVDNLGASVGLTTGNSSGDLGTLFGFMVSPTGPAKVVETVLMRGHRVVASALGPNTSLALHGQVLGAGGAVIVQAETRYADGTRSRSAPVSLSIAYSGTTTGSAPGVFSFSKHVRNDSPFLLELPVSHPDDPTTINTTVLTNPSQSTNLGGVGKWRVFQPQAGANGTDTLTFQASGPGGASGVATVTLYYDDPNPCPPGLNYCVGAPNSVGAGATMGYTGSTSILTNDLVLTCDNLPSSQFGLFFLGQGQTQNPVADGFMCIASNHVRFGALQIGPTGQASMAVDLSNLPGSNQVLAGETWNHQFWYRDPGGGPVGNNLSDGLALVFCP